MVEKVEVKIFSDAEWAQHVTFPLYLVLSLLNCSAGLALLSSLMTLCSEMILWFHLWHMWQNDITSCEMLDFSNVLSVPNTEHTQNQKWIRPFLRNLSTKYLECMITKAPYQECYGLDLTYHTPKTQVLKAWSQCSHVQR